MSFENVRFKGKNIQQQIENFLANTLPQEFNKLFEPFVFMLQRVAPVINALETAIVELEKRRDELLGSLKAAGKGLQEALFTPAQLFEARKDELQTLLEEFRAASPERRIALIPQLTSLTQEVFRLGQHQDVFGEDQDELENLQRQMLQIIAELEAATRDTFNQAIAETKAQIDVLLANLASSQRIEELMVQAVKHLERLVQGTGESFQTLPGEVRRVHTTGVATVHRGEIIGRPK